MKQYFNLIIKATKYPVRLIEETVNRLLYYCASGYSPTDSFSLPHKILITKIDAIGDFVLFTATLSAYRKHFKKCYIVLLVQDNVLNLAETCPYVDEVWGINPSRFRKNVFEHLRWYRKIVRMNFDIAINANYSAKYIYMDCIAAWSKAPRRIAFECLHYVVKRQKPNFYYSELVPDDNDLTFEMDRNYAMLHYLGYDSAMMYAMELWPTADDRKQAAALLGGLVNKPYAILFPGAFDSRRCWKAEKFIMAVRKISSVYPICWALCGSDSEVEMCSSISKKLSEYGIHHLVLAGKTTLRELAVLLERAQFYLGNETSGAHIAVAAGIPSLCILGGGHYGRFFPYPGNPLSIALTQRMPCYKCDWQCKFEEFECVTSVKVEDVVSEALSMLAKRMTLVQSKYDERGAFYK